MELFIKQEQVVVNKRLNISLGCLFYFYMFLDLCQECLNKISSLKSYIYPHAQKYLLLILMCIQMQKKC